MEKIELYTSPQKKMTNKSLKIIAISLLPIFSELFEKIIFNKMYTFLQNEQLLNPNQSGFRPSDLYINQLLSITLKIFQSFGATPPLKVRSVFFKYIKSF